MKKVLTYGTFDLFHIGHVRLLERLSKLGDQLIVGVSTDDFNEQKGKKSFFSFEDRMKIVESCKYVDMVIPEESWDQKKHDIKEHEISVFAIGNDWEGKFDDLKQYCEVEYLERTLNISTTHIKESLSSGQNEDLEKVKKSLGDIAETIKVILNDEK